MSSSDNLANARQTILKATLPHVPFDGWSAKALAAGIQDAGLDATFSTLAFQGGIEEFSDYYTGLADQRMIDALNPETLEAMSVRGRIIHVITLRLQQCEPEREAVRALMVWLALPQNQIMGAKFFYATVDAMWRGIGDTSTDFNFYTKRATMAAVVAAVVLFWLGDETENFKATSDFLDRRIEDVMTIEKAKGKLRKVIKDLPDPFELLGRLREGRQDRRQ